MVSSQSPVTIIGNVTNDPELKFTPSGAAVVNFTVAVNERVKNPTTQEWEDGEASFYRITAWRNLAENIAESISKGRRVIIHGSLKVRQYETKDGTKGTSVEVNADYVGAELTFQTCTINKGTRSNGAAPAAAAAAAPNPWATGGSPASDDQPPF